MMSWCYTPVTKCYVTYGHKIFYDLRLCHIITAMLYDIDLHEYSLCFLSASLTKQGQKICMVCSEEEEEKAKS